MAKPLPPKPLEPASLGWSPHGTPFSDRYQDIYYSANGGIAETHHVFLAGNGLPARWHGREQFTILETGFGSGLNFLVTWQAWIDAGRPCRLHFVSLERHPFRREDYARILARWPALQAVGSRLLAAYPTLVPGFQRLRFEAGQVSLTLLLGDGAEMAAQLDARVDAFFLDGFAPSRNADFWSPALFAQLARVATPDATLATYSVAGQVRRDLTAAGFAVEKAPGPVGKNQMLRGRRVGDESIAPPSPPTRHAAIIGAGVAGCLTAARLAERGWTVDLIERHPRPAQEASGNHAGVLQPLINVDGKAQARFTSAAFLHAMDALRELAPHGARFTACGVLRQARDERHLAAMQRAVAALQPPQDFARLMDVDEAQAHTGWRPAATGLWFPGGGWAQPPSVCRAALAAAGERVRLHAPAEVTAIRHDGERWCATAADGTVLAQTPTLILANAADAARLLPLLLVRVRGQVSLMVARPEHPLHCVVTREGYISPAVDGVHCFGASFDEKDLDPAPREADGTGNLARLEALLPGFGAGWTAAALGARVGFRTRTPDRLPLVGALVPDQPGLWGCLALGSRGLVWAALAAELLVCRITGEPLPLEADLVAALAPSRFAAPR